MDRAAHLSGYDGCLRVCHYLLHLQPRYVALCGSSNFAAMVKMMDDQDAVLQHVQYQPSTDPSGYDDAYPRIVCMKELQR